VFEQAALAAVMKLLKVSFLDPLTDNAAFFGSKKEEGSP
jgi:hypothetical protein